MNTTADERLVVMLEARISEFEKRMRKAEQTGTRSYQGLRRGSHSATAQMEADMVRSTGRINQALAATSSKIGSFGKAFIGGFAGALAIGGVTEAVRRVNELAEGVASVGDQARRAGLSAREFQEWAHVARQNRIGVDALTDGLKELSLRADEFATTGKGSAAEAFERLGYSAAEVARKMKDPSAMLLEIMGRVEQLDRAAQIRIFDELLGGAGGERFVELLEQGSRKIADTKREAGELGLVMSDELIAKADQLNRQFNTIAGTVGVVLKSAIISAAASLSDFIDGFREFENQRSTTLQDRQTAIMRERAEMVAEIGEIRAGGRPDSWGGQIIALEDQIAALTEEEDRIIGILSSRTERTWQPRQDSWTPPPTTPAPPGGKGRKGGGRRDDFQSAMETTERQIAANRAEAESFEDLTEAGRSYGGSMDYAKKRAELLIAAQKMGIDLTPEQIARIEDLARAYADSGLAAEEAKRQFDQIAERAQRGGDAIADIFTAALEGADATRRALSNLLLEMARVQMKQAVFGALGGSGLFGLVGSLLTPQIPKFDGGGSTGNAARSGGLDGKGGFLAMLHPQEDVLDRTRGQASSGHGGTTIRVEVSVNDSGKLVAIARQAGAEGAVPITTNIVSQYHKRLLENQRRR